MVMAPPAEEGEVVMFDLRMPPPVPRATLRHALQRWQYEGAEMDAILHGLEEHVSALEMGAVRMRIEQRRLLVVGEWNGLELGSGQRDGLARHYSRCCRVHLSKPRAVKYTIAASASAAAAAVGGGDSGGQGLELRANTFDATGAPQPPDIVRLAADGAIMSCENVAEKLDRDEHMADFFLAHAHHGPQTPAKAEGGGGGAPRGGEAGDAGAAGACAGGEAGQEGEGPATGGGASPGADPADNLSPTSHVQAELRRATEGLPPDIAALVMGAAKEQ